MAVFGDFLAAESHPSGASPDGALVSAGEIGEGRPLSLPGGRQPPDSGIPLDKGKPRRKQLLPPGLCHALSLRDLREP